MSWYTAKEIMEILPHRAPFLLIDTIEELEPGVRALGKKCVSMNEPYFQGHFPGNRAVIYPELQEKRSLLFFSYQNNPIF